MSLTPDEIGGREFGFGLRGYDQDEVRAFLEQVAEQARRSSVPGDRHSDGAESLQRALDDAAEVRQRAAAEAEIVCSRVQAMLAASQEEAIRLVAEAHVRIERRGGHADSSPSGSGAASPTVEAVGETISSMVRAREEVLQQLLELRAQLDQAVLTAQADPVLGRTGQI